LGLKRRFFRLVNRNAGLAGLTFAECQAALEQFMAIPHFTEDHCASAGESALTIDRRPLDLAFLSSQTMGDRALEAEVLGLFAKQLSSAASALKSADGAERKRLAHALKGTARSLGAFALADIAARLELAPSDRSAAAELEASIIEACGFIASLNR
jgi:HPt (histidine-containing phosphotransfer) domain-containing protein